MCCKNIPLKKIKDICSEISNEEEKSFKNKKMKQILKHYAMVDVKTDVDFEQMMLIWTVSRKYKFSVHSLSLFVIR
jgi:hypothetical protein